MFVVAFVKASLTLPVPEFVEGVMPATEALLQLNVEPDVALVAVYVKAVPLQMAAGVNVLLNTGVGLTATTTFCPVFEQPADVVT